MPIVQIRRNNVHVTYVAPEKITVIMALRDFLTAVVVAEEAIAKWRYDQLGKSGDDPIPIGRSKKPK